MGSSWGFMGLMGFMGGFVFQQGFDGGVDFLVVFVKFGVGE